WIGANRPRALPFTRGPRFVGSPRPDEPGRVSSTASSIAGSSGASFVGSQGIGRPSASSNNEFGPRIERCAANRAASATGGKRRGGADGGSASPGARTRNGTALEGSAVAVGLWAELRPGSTGGLQAAATA